jgi:hypothetical protein
MSLLSFTKCFIGAGGEQAATALTTAMVKMSPEAATAALSGAKAAEEDPNIAAAMAAAGTVANATVADRLAALQQRK